MNEQVKLVLAENPNGTRQQFMIFTQKVVGQGSYGTVKKAIQTTKPQKQLVAKIIPYIDQKKRQKIQKQLDILKNLPPHQNLVYVQPIKCFSTKNYYIFMEYCKDGTLEDLLKKKGKFSQQEVLDFFHQFMLGYKILYDRKILHQDLKPDNILLKKNTYKLTDFGFSIFHQGYKYTNVRQGTLPYMPLEKLTERQYYASTKSDVYALGVILFRMIIGNHPYVVKKPKDTKDYVNQVKKHKLQFQPNTIHTFSTNFQHFFDMVLKMVEKNQTTRIDFPQIFQYMQQQQIFQKFKQKVKQPSTVIIFPQKNKNITIVQHSNAITIPFDMSDKQQNKIKLQAQKIIIEENNKIQKEAINKIQQYIIRNRIIVYFFDRLTRRIYIQKAKAVQYFAVGEQKIILALLLFCKKIVQNVIKQYKNPLNSEVFSQQEIKIYKKKDTKLIKIIQKDQQFLDDLVVDTLTQNFQIKIQEQKQLLDLSSQSFQKYIQKVKNILQNFIKNRALLIKTDKSVITIEYALQGLKILNNFSQSLAKAEQLESYFRFVETQKPQKLLQETIKNLSEYKIEFSIDLGQEC